MMFDVERKHTDDERMSERIYYSRGTSSLLLEYRCDNHMRLICNMVS
jgi:hypothetical protein